MSQETFKVTNIMILEKDALIRRTFSKVLSDVLPGIKIAKADDDTLSDIEKVKIFVEERSPGYRALIGSSHDGLKVLDAVFGTLETSKAIPKPILVSFQSLHFLQKLGRGELLQDLSLYYFLQLPVMVKGLVYLLKYGGFISEQSSIDKVRKANKDDEQHGIAKGAAHSLSGKKAAARILIGAFLAGDIDKEKTTKTFVLMGGSIDKISPLVGGEWRNNALQCLVQAINGRKILFVDDEYKSAGWKFVLDCIFGEKNILYASSKKEALKLSSNDEDVAVILLDLKLPSEPKEGIEALKEIKNVRPDIPVVMFTGEDTIKYQRKSFEKGCFDYFVKEFEEEEKDYLGYYKTFREIIESALAYSEKAVLWRKVILLEKRVTAEDKAYFQQGFHHLRKACYFLTDGEDDWRADLMLSQYGITHYAEVIIQCALAIEAFIKDNEKFIAPSENQESRFQKIKALERAGVLDNLAKRFLGQTIEKRDQYLHSDTIMRGIHVSEEEARKRLSEIIQIFEKVIPAQLKMYKG